VNTADIFVHPQAIVEAEQIGQGTRIWAFTHVMKGATLGANCNVGEQCFLEAGSNVGNDVVVKNGVALWQGVTLEDKVFVGPNAVFTNDMTPRAKVYREHVPTRVCEGASIGANATIRCGIEIGRWAMIGAGAVVTRNVPPFAIVVGNPARTTGFACLCGKALRQATSALVQCSCGENYLFKSGLVDRVQTHESGETQTGAESQGRQS
jgi:acetyltransferase-like isoleucine patch superfamily enzyme